MKKEILLTGVILTLLCGCTARYHNPSPMPVYSPPPQESASRSNNPGSLFASGQADFLFADSRAYRVGDIVLVRIIESTLATNKAVTSSKKSSDTGLQVNHLFGQTSLLGLPVGETPVLGAKSENTFNGDGRTTRQSSLMNDTGNASGDHNLTGDVARLSNKLAVSLNREQRPTVFHFLRRKKGVCSLPVTRISGKRKKPLLRFWRICIPCFLSPAAVSVKFFLWEQHMTVWRQGRTAVVFFLAIQVVCCPGRSGPGIAVYSLSGFFQVSCPCLETSTVLWYSLG